MSIAPELFRAVLGRFSTGVTVVTTRDASSRDHGMTVSAFSSLSLDPPLVLVCIDNNATMAPVMRVVDTFAVNILSADQEVLSRRFADPMDDRFSDLSAKRGPLGNALLEGTLASLECRIVARHPAGDHVIVIGQVEHGEVHHGDHNIEPLVYFRGGYAQLDR